MKSFIQFAVLGVGAGAAYALFAQGAVLIYRGTGLVNFAHGALGMLSAFVTFKTLRIDNDWPLVPAMIGGVVASIVVALAYQWLVLNRLRHAAPIVRLISTLGLLGVLQAGVELKYDTATTPVEQYFPNDSLDIGGVRFDESRIYILAISVAITVALWAFVRYTRVGLAISASAQNERAVRTLGWSPQLLSAVTWTIGAGLAGLAGVIVAPLTGVNSQVFTLVVTVAALAAALLGGFQSFPMTFVGGMVVGIGETLVTNYNDDIEDFLGREQITGLNRGVPFLLILLVLVIRGRGLPLRSHLADRLPTLGPGRLNWPAIVVVVAIFSAMLFWWAGGNGATSAYVSLIGGIMILSIVVLTGYAGQLSLAQWAIGGVGALFAARLSQAAGLPMEIAIPIGVLLAIPAGMIVAIPALRTRGVNLAVVTLGLGFTISEVVFANPDIVSTSSEGIAGPILDEGTRIGKVELFGVKVDALNYPHRWAVVCLVALVLVGLMVANLRRSRTGRRLLAVRTNERAAASLGISVFAVKLYAFGVAAGIAAMAGVLTGFQQEQVTYGRFNVFASIQAVGHAVVGGIGYVIAAPFGAPNFEFGLGSLLLEKVLHIGDWDRLVGGAILFLILITNQNGVGAVISDQVARQRFWRALRLVRPPIEPEPLPEATTEPVPPAVLDVSGLTVRFGAVVAVDDVSFQVEPGEVVGLIGPNGAGKTTVIDAVTGFVTPAAGHIGLDNRSIADASATKRARLGLRRSFQSLELFEDISVEQNIQAGADTGVAWWTWITDLFKPGRHALPSTAVAAVRSFDLEEHLGQLPSELPYGRRRLVGIARAVASGPSIIMLDEPAAGLDEVESRELAGLIRALADERRMGVLLVEHDVGLVMSTCDRIVVIDFGRVIATGTPDEVRNDPAVKAAYLGTSDQVPDNADDEGVLA